MAKLIRIFIFSHDVEPSNKYGHYRILLTPSDDICELISKYRTCNARDY